jgi:hypothetical protein
VKELILEAKNGDKLFWDWQNWYSVQKFCPMIAKLDAWSKARQGRKVGAYWIKREVTEVKLPAWWNGNAWLVPGWRGWHSHDATLAAIDERRILPPE